MSFCFHSQNMRRSIEHSLLVSYLLPPSRTCIYYALNAAYSPLYCQYLTTHSSYLLSISEPDIMARGDYKRSYEYNYEEDSVGNMNAVENVTDCVALCCGIDGGKEPAPSKKRYSSRSKNADSRLPMHTAPPPPQKKKKGSKRTMILLLVVLLVIVFITLAAVAATDSTSALQSWMPWWSSEDNKSDTYNKEYEDDDCDEEEVWEGEWESSKSKDISAGWSAASEKSLASWDKATSWGSGSKSAKSSDSKDSKSSKKYVSIHFSTSFVAN